MPVHLPGGCLLPRTDGQTWSRVGWKPDCHVTQGSCVCARGAPPAGSAEAPPGPRHCLQPPRGGALQAGPGPVTHNPALTQLSPPKEFNTMAFLLYLH